MGGSGEFPSPQSLSIPMRYAVLLRDVRLSVPVFDDQFKAEEFSTIFGALKGLQVRMVKFEHNLDKIELGMNKLEHRIDSMELHMEQLQKELDLDLDLENPDSPRHPLQQHQQQQQHYYIEDCPSRTNNCPQDRGPQDRDPQDRGPQDRGPPLPDQSDRGSDRELDHKLDQESDQQLLALEQSSRTCTFLN